VPPRTTVGFLGPQGTFTEEALLTRLNLPEAEPVALSTIEEVLALTERGEVDFGFVPIENAIEGTVNATLDLLVFETDLLIQAEAVLEVHLHLMARPGVGLEDVRQVASFPHASAQCRRFLAERLPGVPVRATNSTAEAAALVGTGELGEGAAAIAPRLAAKLYGLDVLAESVEDHEQNATRFLLVARDGIPEPTGHDRTSIVCFQDFDRPGSLHGLLGQFAARDINLSKLESRPTKRALGDYCFVIDLEGHVADEVVADCLRDLHAQSRRVKFLGSYPVADDRSASLREERSAAWRAADEWIAGLRAKVGAGRLVRQEAGER
jgi:prephenate dehydratase